MTEYFTNLMICLIYDFFLYSAIDIDETVDQMFLREPETAAKVKRTISHLNKPYLRKVRSRFDPTPWLCCKDTCGRNKCFQRISDAVQPEDDQQTLESVASTLVRMHDEGEIFVFHVPHMTEYFTNLLNNFTLLKSRSHDEVDADGAVGHGIMGAVEEQELQQRRLQREMWPFLVDARYRYLNRVKSEYYNEAEMGKGDYFYSSII